MASYYIAFDTKDMAPNLKATKVTLNYEMISDMNKQLPINLAEDPLYPALHAYCMANPPRKIDGAFQQQR